MYYLCALSCIIMYWFYRQSKRLSCWYMKFARPFWTSGLYVRLFEVIKHSMILRRHGQLNHQWWPEASTKNWNLRVELIIFDVLNGISIPTGSMYAVYGNIYHQYAPNVSIYTIHGSYGYDMIINEYKGVYIYINHQLNLAQSSKHSLWSPRPDPEDPTQSLAERLRKHCGVWPRFCPGNVQKCTEYQ